MRILIGRDELESLVPHSGDMCLLHGVTAWDETSVTCISESHLAADNPLRARGRLAAVHALEYGAQAMAVHGGLLARQRGERSGGGYLAALRNARLHVSRLDDIAAPLTIRAERLMAAGANLMYQFTITAGGLAVAEARATVVGQTEKEQA